MTTHWQRAHRATGDGWNVVVGDGLHIGPIPHDKANAIVRDHNAEMSEKITEIMNLRKALRECLSHLDEYEFGQDTWDRWEELAEGGTQ